MARTDISRLLFRVVDPSGELVGATRHAQDAVVLVNALDAGGTIRDRHGRVLWRNDTDSAPDGWRAALKIYQRMGDTVYNEP